MGGRKGRRLSSLREGGELAREPDRIKEKKFSFFLATEEKGKQESTPRCPRWREKGGETFLRFFVPEKGRRGFSLSARGKEWPFGLKKGGLGPLFLSSLNGYGKRGKGRVQVLGGEGGPVLAGPAGKEFRIPLPGPGGESGGYLGGQREEETILGGERGGGVLGAGRMPIVLVAGKTGSRVPRPPPRKRGKKAAQVLRGKEEKKQWRLSRAAKGEKEALIAVLKKEDKGRQPDLPEKEKPLRRLPPRKERRKRLSLSPKKKR